MPIVSGGVVYEEVAVTGSRQASLVGKHLAAVQQFLGTGDDRVLRSFAGRVVTGTLPSGQRLRFDLDVDPDDIAGLAFSGELHELVVES